MDSLFAYACYYIDQSWMRIYINRIHGCTIVMLPWLKECDEQCCSIACEEFGCCLTTRPYPGCDELHKHRFFGSMP